ncbi:hypothetical protein MATL_G00156270 [Megalops atlanticus]|uniref:DUF4549 domain-containing protein n=1 Tax=Megalops atlanticus TaxID=7932 RepID=A0A9D3PU34_MEGAT|nr:hypothetical protein MATL_G00156270 [Megalops atlanticus]
MAELYRMCSTEKLQQMEKELATQLSALRTEIEENGVLGGTPSKSYSSVPIPKDVSYFRMEREQVLRTGLQVSGARPLVSQAEVMQRELESCRSREYTPESLPLLLHQFYVDRCSQLAQCKYLHMLRWRRFSRHTGVIEKLYPFYKRQVALLMGEYEDAVERAHRLAVSREKALTGRGNPINAITQEDVVIYLQWLVCHLHSIKTIHSFLGELQYLPACERVRGDSGSCVLGESPKPRDSSLRVPGPPNTASSRPCSSTGTGVSSAKSSLQDGPALTSSTKSDTIWPGLEGLFGGVTGVPKHTVMREEFGPQLQHLLSHFSIQYSTQDMTSPADEMELLGMVSHEFRAVFRKQEVMKRFPVYGGSEAAETHWGRKSANMALRKEANWIPFIRVTPRRDPWEQKRVTHLQQHQQVDELLHMQCRFLQVSDPLRVMQTLQEHAAHVADSGMDQPPSVTSHLTAQSSAHIWRRIYSPTDQSQESGPEGAGETVKGKPKRGSTAVTTTQDSYSYTDSLRRLGLDDGQEGGSDGSVRARGAYLSLLYLRHLRIRQLQRSCLGMLNYLRSVERTLAFDVAGLHTDSGELGSSAEESAWMSAARGGSGTQGGLGSQLYLHNTPADYKVHLAEFMEFSEVENHHDYHSSEEGCVHTQGACGLYIVYDVALRDLEELEHLLLLLASHYIQRNAGQGTAQKSGGSGTDVQFWAQMDVDRLAVLLDLWTCEEAFLQSKMQLLDCYFEAYQHVTDSGERFSLAQVITDVMHRRPRLDLGSGYFVQAYRAELGCLQSHQQLLRLVLNCQIEEQRQYLQRIWRGGQRGSAQDYGMPLNYIPKQLVTLGNSSPALKSVYLLEVHPSLYLASRLHQALSQAHSELCQLHGARTPGERLALEQRLLLGALNKWESLASREACYNSQTQKDLFSDVFFEDPLFVRDVGVAVLGSAEGEEKRRGKERQFLAVETFSKLLELVTLRHRLMESASETALLSQLYHGFAWEMGFEEFHLHLRPVQFEFAVLREKPEKPPLFITALLGDRYTPSSLPLSIQEIDESQIGRFSFRTEDAVIQLMSRSGIENLQVALACQVTHKNALIGAVKQACLCYWANNRGGAEGQEGLGSSTGAGKDGQVPQTDRSTNREKAHRPAPGVRKRPAEAFVSLQLERVGLRDEMLNAFVRKKEVMGTVMKNPEEVEKIKRKLILEFCEKFSTRMSQCCVRAQIVGLYHSLNTLLEDLPTVRSSHFMQGGANEQKNARDSELGLQVDPRSFQSRPRCVLSADGRTLLNLWFIPHFSEVLLMFRALEEAACQGALNQTLEIVSALHDIIYYLVSFARLGNSPTASHSRTGQHLTADWGGAEGIGAELWDIQRQIDSLDDPTSPEAVGRLLRLRREALFLQFDAAVRQRIRESFLSSGDSAAYQTVTDNMGHALPLLSDSVRGSVYSSQLPLPQPLEPHSPRAQRLFPWRCFLGQHGTYPLAICDTLPIEYCMQLCLSGLRDRSRMVANGEILGVSLLMEDVLNCGQDAAPLRLHVAGDDDPQQRDEEEEGEGVCETDSGGGAGGVAFLLAPHRDPMQMYSALRAFLLLWKQLEVFRDSWGRRQLGVEQINTPALYKRFSRLYRAEILYPSMRAVARRLGREDEYGSPLTDTQPVTPPTGASEADIKTQQLHRLLQCTESDMIIAVQRRIAWELNLVISERARQDTGLPTELWKRGPVQHIFSPERPLILENFTQQLMEGGEQAEGKVTFSQAHLRACLTALGCAVMGRERSCFQAYSLFYQHILQQEAHLLYQREQDVKALEASQRQDRGADSQVAELCRGMMAEITALRSRVAHMQEDRAALQEQLSTQHQQRYEALIRHLFSTCLQLKCRLDEYHVRMDRDVGQLVSMVRREAVASMEKLKRRFGSSKDDADLRATLSKHTDLQALQEENSQLLGLICKMRALNQWKQSTSEGKLRSQLHQCRQEAFLLQKESVTVKTASEEEVKILQQELEAVRRALEQCQEEYNSTRTLLQKQGQQLQEAEHRQVQEERSRQQLDGLRAQTLQRLQEDASSREQQLRSLSAQMEQSSWDSRLQRLRSQQELRRVKSQLLQERSLKQDAFQRVDELQSQVYEAEAVLSRGSPAPGGNRKCQSAVSRSATSSRRVLSGLLSGKAKRGRPPALSPRGLVGEGHQDDPSVDPETHPMAVSVGSETRLQRPRTGPSRLRSQIAEALLPDLDDGGSPTLLTQLQQLKLGQHPEARAPRPGVPRCCGKHSDGSQPACVSTVTPGFPFLLKHSSKTIQ